MNFNSVKGQILANPPSLPEKKKAPVKESDFIPYWADDGDYGPPIGEDNIENAIDAIEDAISDARAMIPADMGYLHFTTRQKFRDSIGELRSSTQARNIYKNGVYDLSRYLNSSTYSLQSRINTVEWLSDHVIKAIDLASEFAEEKPDLPPRDELPDTDPGLRKVWIITSKFSDHHWNGYTQNKPPRLNYREIKSEWNLLSDLCLTALSPTYAVRNNSGYFSEHAKAMSEIPYTWKEMEGDFDAKPEAVHKALVREFKEELRTLSKGPWMVKESVFEADKDWYRRQSKNLEAKSQILWDFFSSFKIEYKP